VPLAAALGLAEQPLGCLGRRLQPAAGEAWRPVYVLRSSRWALSYRVTVPMGVPIVCWPGRRVQDSAWCEARANSFCTIRAKCVRAIGGFPLPILQPATQHIATGSTQVPRPHRKPPDYPA
jgi:hypothetical protein